MALKGNVLPATPSEIAALENGVQNGRGGKGTIYSFAAGNGRLDNANSNNAGHQSSRYVFSVAAIADDGGYSWYSEPGANLLVAAPSNGGTKGITTTDNMGAYGYDSTDYTNTFGGTSSACPLFSGTVALMLDANPNLSWRDVQHIIAKTADKIDPTNPGWLTNGAGFDFNHDYGFGRLDAEEAVSEALTWNNVSSEVEANYSSSPNTSIPDNSATGITETILVTQDIKIETIEIPIQSNHSYYPNLEIKLTSPGGTTAMIAEQRTVAQS
jgi:subtilisin family serine protease